MSTPKYEANRSRRTLQDDKLRWSADCIVAHGNLTPRTRNIMDPVVKDCGDYTVNHPPHHRPWGSSRLTSTPSSSYTALLNPPPLRPGKFFGTPSISAKRERAAQLGINLAGMEASFEGNQSFPKVARRRRSRPDPIPSDVAMNPMMPGPKLEALQGDGMNDISFSSIHPRKKYFPRIKDAPLSAIGSGSSAHKSLSESWSFSGLLGNIQSSPTCPSTVRNPNKAICTIAASTSEILTANDMACELFGYEESELVGRALRDLLRLKSREQETITESHLEPSGQIISLAGKVVEVLDSHGLVLPISLWVKRLDTSSTSTSPRQKGGGGEGAPEAGRGGGEDARLLCVMEPVERTVAHVTFDAEGEIQWCDDHMAQLCGYAGPHQVSGLHMTQIIPAFHCPDPLRGLTKDVKKQRATGRTRDGMSFPLSVVVRPDDGVHDGRWIPPSQEGYRESGGRPLYRATVWVFANISGLISIRPDGTIHSLNENFARLLFGYSRCELIGQSISKLIPDFFDLLEMENDPVPLPPLDDEDDEVYVDDRDSGRLGEPRKRATLSSSGDSCLSPSSPRDRSRRLPSASTPAVYRSVRDDSSPALSTPCSVDVEISIVSSDSQVSIGSSVSQKEERSPTQRESFTKSQEFSPVIVCDASFPALHADTNPSPPEEESQPESGPLTDTAYREGSEDLTGPEPHASHSSTAGNAPDVDNTMGVSKPDGRKKSIGFVTESKDLIGESGQIAVESKDAIGRGLSDVAEIETAGAAAGKPETNQNNSCEACVGLDSKQDSRLQDVTHLMIGGEDLLGHQLGKEKCVDPKDLIMDVVCHSPESEDVIGCEDIAMDVYCDNDPSPRSDDSDKPVPLARDDACRMLSPIKSFNPDLCNDSFASNSSENADSVGDMTSDLLAAKVGACDISDLVWSEDEERQGLSSGQGVAADVSGNLDDSSRGTEDQRSSLEDGRMSRLSRSDPFSLRTKIISDTAFDTSGSASDEAGPVDEQFLALLPTAYGPRSPLDTSGAGSTTYLEDESSYFSREGASVSQPGTDSTGSQSSSCAQGISDTSLKDCPEARSFRNAGFNMPGAARTRADLSTSTDPRSRVGSRNLRIPEGSFSGQGRHKDGGTLGIVFQIRRVMLVDGSEMLLLWVSRDPEDMCDASRSHGNLTLASSFCSTLDQSHHSLGELLQEQANAESKLEDILESVPTTTTTTATLQPPSQRQSDSDQSLDDEDEKDDEEVSMASAGQFSEQYMALSSIGKGAFGFVRRGRRRKDGQEVVVKFIRRTKVLRESWVKDPTLDVIPMEVFLLLRLNHPNIVKVLDVFQNADFVQLVMERHGSGMDLFEFIDRNPTMDEPLTSYIFRQMVSGVSYLHAENVVHRDIKDENIIIDERFHIKLIDFGAATYMLPGRLFATFCGTIEYCSPEVLSGNKYRGPELEMWSLGITLYTLIFGENPFFDVEETLQGVLKPPSTVSRALMFLITWLLHPDPLCRATISDLERNAWVSQPVDISHYQWEKVLSNTEFFGNTACDNREDTADHSLVGRRSSASTVRKYHQDSPDSFTCFGAKDNNSLSPAHSSVHRHGSTNSSAHSSEESSLGRGDTTAEHSAFAFGDGERHSPRAFDDGGGGVRDDRIAGVASDFSRLLQLHSHLDGDY